MYLSKFQLFNYKSFLESDVIDFKPGINIIAGQNNSGKTALLEALKLDFDNAIHRSIKTQPTSSSIICGSSKARILLVISKTEFRELLNHILPLRIPQAFDETIAQEKLVNLFETWLKQSEPDLVEFSLIFLSQNKSIINTDDSKNLSFGLYDIRNYNEQGKYRFLTIKQQIDAAFKPYGDEISGIEETIAAKLFYIFRNRIYRFYAERLNIGSCGFGSTPELQPNASNLAEALNILQANSYRFDKFNRLVSVIFPHIKRITIKPKGNPSNHLEIMVWPILPDTEREDLAFPLSSCGTGIGQVLAILYVVLTSQEPRVIIIDEPQSFLHPGAAKKLIEIIREFSQHQYFIATHSPTIISTANPSTIVMLRYENCETSVSVMNAEDRKELSNLMDELGVKLSDVFGADNILWVEGPTEEGCFRKILETKRPLRGTTILAVSSTGDFDKKDPRSADIIFKIYEKVSGKESLFPPAIGFVFDKEDRRTQQIDDMIRKSGDKLKFLPRRMYENYLLHPEAIAAIINEADKQEQKESVTATKIEECLKLNKQKEHYFYKDFPKEKLSDPKWVDENIHAAKLLEDLFSELSETRVIFRKPLHPIKLTEWLLKKEPNHFDELADFLESLL